MCLRRRFYKADVRWISAGEKREILYHKGKIYIRQLTLFYDADNNTGTHNNKWIIKIDSDEILNMKLIDIHECLAGCMVCKESDRPVVSIIHDSTYKIYCVILRDVGIVNEGIEIWIDNVDTSNGCSVRVGMIYDVLE